MTSLDILVLLLLGGGAVFGFMRGFVHEILALAAWAWAFAAVWLFYDPVAAFLEDFIGTPGGASLLGYAGIFIIALAIGKFAASYIGRRSRASFLGPIDRVLGFGFGAVKSLFVVAFLFILFTIGYETTYAENARPEWMTGSRTYPLLNATSNAVIDYVDERRGLEKDIST